MNKLRCHQFRQILTLTLIVCLSLQGAAFGMGLGKKGQKDFKEGMKYEIQQQWDLAANEFAKAVAADPGNAEYRLHFFRSMQGASIMFMKRGDELLQQNDTASAYNAYRQSFAYDQTNELAKVKMERIIDQQKALAIGATPVNFDPRTGNAIANPDSIEISTRPTRAQDLNQNITWRDTGFKTLVTGLSNHLGLNVVMDETVKDTKVSLSLQNTTEARALDNLLLMTKHTFEQVDRRTIFIYQDNPTNRQRFERLFVKTFYLGNVELQAAQQAVQQLLTGTAKQVFPVKQQNALVVRASQADLKVIGQILSSLDKNRPEVVLDVDIYEVSQSAKTQIGNQLATSSSNFTTGGTTSTVTTDGKPVTTTTGGRTGISPGLGNLAGFSQNVGSLVNALTIGGGISQFAFFGLPTSTLSLLQSNANSKLLASTQVHALDGEANETKVGRKVPIQIGQATPNYGITTGQTGTGTGSAVGGINNGLGLGYSSIQYQDVGLVIKVTPTITNDGYVQVKMDLTSSNVEPAASDAERLTPSFTQRSLSTISRIADGKTSVVAGVKQQSNGNSRTTVPILGMVPILGRLFSTPNQDSSTSDIIITVTPHIIRSAEIKSNDHLAKSVGTLGGGNTLSIEEVVSRAQVEDEQERRMIAVQRRSGDPTGGQVASALIDPLTAPNYNPQPKVEVVNDPIPTPQTQLVSNGLTQPPRSAGALPDNPFATTPTPTPAVANPLERNQVEKASLPARPQAPANSTMELPKNIVISQSSEQKNKEPRAENVPDDAQQFVPEGPKEPVKPAALSSMKRPEHIEKMIREAEKAKAEGKVVDPEKTNKKEEDEMLRKLMEQPVEGPKQPVKPATIQPIVKPKAKPGDKPTDSKPTVSKPAESKPADATNPPARPAGKPGESMVELNMMPTVIKGQVGKSFLLVLSLDGQATMTGANIALKYDPAMLQVKAVRDAGLLGKRPDLTHQVDGGNLTITMQQASDREGPVKTNGRLLIVEFTAIGNGNTTIDVNSAETQLLLSGVRSAGINATAAQVQISGEALTKLSNEK